MALEPRRMLRGALAGGIAAGVWALQQPLDKRALRCDYDDVELLGRSVLPRAARARWYPVGLLLHVQNGAMFGAVHAGVLGPALVRSGLPRALGAPLVAQVENFGLWPLGRVSDRFHPARDELPRLTGNRSALAQATWRHMLFGVVLGELERRLNRDAAELPVPAA